MRPFSNIFFAGRYLASLLFSFVELMLFIRFILRLFGANSRSDFVQWMYETTFPLISPFVGIFPNPKIDGRFVLEFSTVFAWLIYMLIYMAVVEVIRFFEVMAKREAE